MNFLAYLIFVPLQLVWLPLSVVGAMMVGYRQLVVSKKLGVSQTAVEVINGRWAMDVFGLREDSAARKLAASIPNNSVPGLWLTLFPLWLVHKAVGVHFLYPTLPNPEKAGIADLVPSRTVVFDELIEANLPEAAQLVVLGAGLDTRAYGPLIQSDVVIYELDQTADQSHKRRHLASAKIDSSQVRFVEVDFADPKWINALLATDYDPAKKTIFLWEGVTLYLSARAVQATLAAAMQNAVPASVVIADIYAERFVSLTKNKAISWSLELTDEEIVFGLDCSIDAEERLRKFIESQSLTMGSHQFLGGAHKKGPFAVIVEMVI
ncbi:MAG: SAM-dependent methyltransferase [Pseudomonadota bacterium]